MYEVCYGVRRGKKFDDIADAVEFARKKATDAQPGEMVAIWQDSVLVIAVVTDDADGVVVHPLKTWPDDLPKPE